MRLIGFNGKKGSGKDTAGAYLVERYGFERMSFAAPLKVSAAASLGILCPDAASAVALWDEWKNDPTARIRLTVTERDADGHAITDIDFLNISVREYLQFFGTEGHREVFGEDFWTKQALDSLDPDGSYVFTDSRFENECAALRDAGGVIINIDRDGVDMADAHASETPLPDELVDTVLYNHGTIEELHRTIDAYMSLSGLLEDEGGSIEAVGVGRIDITV